MAKGEGKLGKAAATPVHALPDSHIHGTAATLNIPVFSARILLCYTIWVGF